MLKRYIIKYNLQCETGLLIGSGNTGFDIGGADTTVIRNPLTQVPYIPGSSLKGKMRTLSEWLMEVVREDGKVHSCEENQRPCLVCQIFGRSAIRGKKGLGSVERNLTRLIVRDLDLTPKSKEEIQRVLGRGIFVEVKPENTINRLTSMANPRFFERIPAGAEFEGEFVLTIFEEDNEKAILKGLYQAMNALEDSYLGAGGSRGSGKVKFKNVQVVMKENHQYEATQACVYQDFNDLMKSIE